MLVQLNSGRGGSTVKRRTTSLDADQHFRSHVAVDEVCDRLGTG